MIRLFSLTSIHHAKNRKAYQGSLQVSSTNESGVRALALPHTWVLLGSWTVGKAMGRPFYVQTKGQLFPTCLSYAGYAHQREESPAALFLIAFLSSVFWYCTVFCLSSADFRRREVWKDGIPWCFFIPLPFSLPRMWRMGVWKSDSSSHEVFSFLCY